MVTVTFLYKKNGTRMFGKCVGLAYNEDVAEVTQDILYYVSPYLNDYFNDMSIGIISVMEDINFSIDEKNVFDFLYISRANKPPNVYLYGDLIEI
jgi:hypothetical protein